MSYDDELEYIESETFTQKETKKILIDHGFDYDNDFDDFFMENGYHDTYSGKTVFHWLGY